MKTDYKETRKAATPRSRSIDTQVRRKRWVKKGLLPPRPDTRDSSFSIASDGEEHGRFHSLWRRLQQCDFSRSTSPSMTSTNFSQLESGGTGAPRGRRLTNSTSVPSNIVGERRPPVLSDTVLYSNSPHFHQTPHSPFVNVAVGGPRTARSASYVAGTGNSMRPRRNTRSARNSFYGGARQIDTVDESIEAKSDYGGGHGIRASVRRWYSTMDVLDFGRRSKFNDEYFDTDDDRLDEDDSQMEDGRGRYHAAMREGHLTEQHGA
ncbi:hypothetical protein PsorP6_003706 [Peronosclerospora sorghi]|uniref:Uncharacterized protein n=1 Tax=Peronosclerospora sorghi TaxID=230839 RepID=A0ACC0VQ58_9STRA|nr:hypothetical protein PsorP6_003706 [Peronosclerospora sorghi]